MNKYIKIESNEFKLLKEPAQILSKGGIGIFPTETVYGIGVNALDENAIEKLYIVKEREREKPTSVLVSNKEMIKMLAENISDKENKIIEQFFPGPLTIILKKKKNISDVLTGSKDTIGIRMPDNDIALKLIEYAGVPIATSSANIAHEESQTNIANLLNKFENKVDFFVDGGESKIGIASTIIQIVNNEITILRERNY